MSTNYSPTIVTDGAVFVGDARMPSISEPGTRLYNRAGVDSADVKLLVQGNVGSGQSFTDSSLSNHTVTAVGDVTHSTAQSKFSGGSIYFDGTGDYLSVPDSSDWAFGAGDFTIDFWLYSTNNSQNYRGLVCHVPSPYTSATGLFIEVNVAQLRLFVRNGSGDLFTELNSSGSAIAVDTWYHVAVVRSGNTMYLYLNGSALGSASYSGTWPDWSDPLHIGFRKDQTKYFEGYMDEVRITKGVALWTQNFTPPARRDTLSISDGMMYNGSCLNFDGTDERVFTSGYFGALAGDDDVTLCAWINVDTTGDMGIVSIGNVYMSIIVSGGYLEARCYNGGSVLTNTDVHAITAGQWCHVAGVFSGGNVTLYKNGVAAAAVACSNQSIAESATYFQLGRGAAGAIIWMNGQMSNPMAFNTTLSASQIKEIYQDSKVIIPSNVSQTNLKGFWTFAEGAGDICYDGSGRGIDGTFDNMEAADWLTGQTGCPQLVEGYNRPMLFPGATTDYVAVGNTSEFCFGTSDFSFGAWIKTSNTATFNMVFDALQPVNQGWQFGVYGTSPYMRLWASTGSAQVSLDSSTNVCDGQWHHVGFTSYAGSPQLVTLYVDGSADASSGSMGALNMVGGAYASWIGGQVAGPNYPFDGLINEVVLYDALLSSSEMAALAATGPNGGPLPPDPMSGASNLSAASNVKGYWRNDGDVTWTDRSGEGNNGTVGGSPDALLFKQGYNGSKNVNTGRDGQGFPLKYKDVGAIGFDGTGTYIEVPASNGGELDITENITLAAWCFAESKSSWRRVIARRATASSGLPYMMGLNDDADQKWNFYIDGSSGATSLNSSGAASIRTWVYVVGVLRGTAMELYLNGELDNSTTHSGGLDAGGADPNVQIGSQLMPDTTGYVWDGQIANVKIYNRGLSHAEIKQNYNAQKSRFT